MVRGRLPLRPAGLHAVARGVPSDDPSGGRRDRGHGRQAGHGRQPLHVRRHRRWVRAGIAPRSTDGEHPGAGPGAQGCRPGDDGRLPARRPRVRPTAGHDRAARGLPRPRWPAVLVGAPLFRAALDGKPALWLGSADHLHSFTFLPDAARALVTLGERVEADGQLAPPGGRAGHPAALHRDGLRRGRYSNPPAHRAGELLRLAGVVGPSPASWRSCPTRSTGRSWSTRAATRRPSATSRPPRITR